MTERIAEQAARIAQTEARLTRWTVLSILGLAAFMGALSVFGS